MLDSHLSWLAIMKHSYLRRVSARSSPHDRKNRNQDYSLLTSESLIPFLFVSQVHGFDSHIGCSPDCSVSLPKDTPAHAQPSADSEYWKIRFKWKIVFPLRHRPYGLSWLTKPGAVFTVRLSQFVLLRKEHPSQLLLAEHWTFGIRERKTFWLSHLTD